MFGVLLEGEFGKTLFVYLWSLLVFSTQQTFFSECRHCSVVILPVGLDEVLPPLPFLWNSPSGNVPDILNFQLTECGISF